jgi:hypothetical protein
MGKQQGIQVLLDRGQVKGIVLEPRMVSLDQDGKPGEQRQSQPA